MIPAKVNYRIFTIIITLGIAIYFSSCNRCDDKAEPTLLVTLPADSNYYEAYGVNGLHSFTLTKEENELPLPINSDTVIYIFFTENSQDTLCLSYHREIEYDSDRCGYTVYLDDFRILEPTSFDSLYYIDEHYKDRFPWRERCNAVIILR
ncbi:MAG: hypothetical protein KKA07_13830 [Bacteroidetes bacterium]|nr:hypothetical protein [Bacteroidota bacterium]MBU1720141.1 hypothetical protein [Bacteroidota bacterium]